MNVLATQFHQLHQRSLLILTNVADATGARLVEHLGGKAVATSSAAVAWAHGYPDGNALPLERLVSTVESIARVISIPLTVDVEAGYSDDLGRVAEVLDAVIAAGAVGINIEDGSADPELLARKIEVARQVAGKRDVQLFINARTDVYLKSLVPAEDRVAEPCIGRRCIKQRAPMVCSRRALRRPMKSRPSARALRCQSMSLGSLACLRLKNCKRWACAA